MQCRQVIRNLALIAVVMSCACEARVVEQSDQEATPPPVASIPDLGILADRLHASSEGAAHSLPSRENWLREQATKAPAGPQPVTIYARRGETPAMLAEWSGLSANEIVDDNELFGLTGDEGADDTAAKLKPGLPLTLVMSAEQLDEFEAERRAFHQSYRDKFFDKYEVIDVSTYTVKKGDSPWKVRHRSKHAVPMWLLEDNNSGAELDTLMPGQALKIPVVAVAREGLPTAVEAVAVGLSQPTVPARIEARDHQVQIQRAPAPEENLVVKLRSGESLSHLAAWSGLSIAIIAQVNGLSDPNKVYIGQRLELPVPENRVADFFAHRRDRNRAAAQTAQRTPSRPNANKPRTNRPRAQVAAKKKPVAKKAKPAAGPPPGTQPYQIQEGENAWNIATRGFGISLARLQELNPGKNLQRLGRGDLIYVPVK